METTREFLEVIAAKGTLKKEDGYLYTNMHDLVLREGQGFHDMVVSEDWGPPGNCYTSTLSLVTDDRDRYVYCEGFALSAVPVLHAWAWDRKINKVIETTWEACGTEYIGVMFRFDFAAKRVIEHGCIIDDWQNKWPVLKLTPEEFSWRDGTKLGEERYGA